MDSELAPTTALLNKNDNQKNGESGNHHNAASAKSSDKELKGKLTTKLLLAIFACVIGSSFQFGFHSGVLNTPQQVLQNEYEYGFESGKENSTRVISDDKAVFLWAVTVSIFGAGGLVAGFTGSYIATWLGRKKMMLYNNILLVIAVAFMMSAKFAKHFELMIVGRLVHGFNAGFSTVVAPLYLNEISPVNIRGGVGTVNQLAVTSGILISQVLGLYQILGSVDLYYLLFGVPLIGAGLQLLILPFCPESPAWLYINKGKPEESRKALNGFNGAFHIDKQLQAYEAEASDLKEQPKLSFKDMFTKSYLRTPLLIAIVMHLSQQWSGIQAVLNYSTSIFTSVGLSEGNAQYATIGSTAVIVFMTIVSILFMDRAGRRPLHLIGLTGCLMSMIIITIALFLREQHDWAKYVSIVSLVLFIMSFAIGPGSIPWFITAELFDQSARHYAVSIATLVNWAANFTSGLLFPIMQKGMKEYCFIPFIVLLVLFVVFTFIKLPETKNKSIEEVVAMFKRGSHDGVGKPGSQNSEATTSLEHH